jgi:hypothetical protein
VRWLAAILAAAAATLGVSYAQASHGARRGPCAQTMPVDHVGRGVRVTHAGGARVKHPKQLENGDRVRVPDGRHFVVHWRGNRYVLRRSRAQVTCASMLITRRGPQRRMLALTLEAGSLRLQNRGRLAGAVLTPNALVVVRGRGPTAVYRFATRTRTVVLTRARGVEVADVRRQRLRVAVRRPEKAIMDGRRLRLNTYPFAISPQQRVIHRRSLRTRWWRDGRSCSAGCRAPGARPGWPLKPFHRQHALRSGLNELRPANFHVGIDIQARDFQRVYPMSSGRVHVVQASGYDERVRVGRFIYWHIEHRVHEGQHVRAYHSVLGTVKRYYHHLHLSEVVGGDKDYINPLRPGGRNLRPWSDTEPPVIGRPRIGRGGRARVAAFDPQSYIVRIRNVTPVLAPAALAWRLSDAHGHRITGLRFALRGSQHLPDGLRRTVYTPRARNPGFLCFDHHTVCIPRWDYRLAGGMTTPLPTGSLRRGRYRLTVYAWDWAGNASARSRWFKVHRHSRAERAPKRFPPLHPRPDVQ